MLDSIREEFSCTDNLDFGVVDSVRGFEVVGILRSFGVVGVVVVGKVVGRGIVKGIGSNIINLVGDLTGCLSYWTYPLAHRPR